MEIGAGSKESCGEPTWLVCAAGMIKMRAVPSAVYGEQPYAYACALDEGTCEAVAVGCIDGLTDGMPLPAPCLTAVSYDGTGSSITESLAWTPGVLLVSDIVYGVQFNGGAVQKLSRKLSQASRSNRIRNQKNVAKTMMH